MIKQLNDLQRFLGYWHGCSVRYTLHPSKSGELPIRRPQNIAACKRRITHRGFPRKIKKVIIITDRERYEQACFLFEKKMKVKRRDTNRMTTE